MMADVVERTVEIALLGLIAFPLTRLAIDPGVRRRFRAFPRVQSAMVVALLLYASIVAAIALTQPALLRPAAGAALVVLFIERWQARADHGRSRGLPPGSLAFMPISPWRDPEYYQKQAARHGPVFKFRHFVFPAIGIVGLDRAADFLSTNGENLIVPPAPFNGLVRGGFVRYLNAERHRDVATALRSAMTPAMVDACEPALAAEARIALQTLASRPNRDADPFPVIDRMILLDLIRCFFGIGPGPQFHRLEAQYRIADYRRLARTGRKRGAAAVFAIVEELRASAPHRNDNSFACPESFLGELLRIQPDALDDDELMSNFVYALHTARLDLGGLLVWLLVKLAENPSWMARLASELETNRAQALRPGGLADRMVRETLRLHQSEFLLRRVKNPIRWSGLDIPAGWYVRVCVQESHRSADMFDSPDIFDPDRFLHSPNRKRYSPFGLPPRICPGAHLSRAIGRHLTAELASSYELRVYNAEPAEFTGFHWKPSSRLRASLQARA